MQSLFPSSLAAMCGQHRSPTKDQLVSWKIHPNSTKPLIGRLATKSKGVSLILAPVIFASQHERVESWSSKVYQCIKFFFRAKKGQHLRTKKKAPKKKPSPLGLFSACFKRFSPPQICEKCRQRQDPTVEESQDRPAVVLAAKNPSETEDGVVLSTTSLIKTEEKQQKNVWSKRNRLPKKVKEEKADFGVGRRGRPRVSRYFFQRCFDSWMFSFFA